MDIKELNKISSQLSDSLLKDISTIIANEAVNHFKDNFETKKGS